MDTYIKLHGIKHSDALEVLVREQAEGLEHFFDRIITCRVAIERSQTRRGGPYHVRIDLRVPGGEIVVSRRPSLHSTLAGREEQEETKAAEIEAPYKDAFFAVSQAFRVAGRRLQDYVRRNQGAVKVHEAQPQAKIVRLDPEKEYGFLEADDGHEVYFHRNSVLDDGFDRLGVGTTVTFVEELGEQGPQASTVRIASRPETTEAVQAVTDDGVSTSVGRNGPRTREVSST